MHCEIVQIHCQTELAYCGIVRIHRDSADAL